MNWKQLKIKSFLDFGLVVLMIKSLLDISLIRPSDRVDTLLSLLGAAALAIHILIVLKKKFSIRVFFVYAALSLIALYHVLQTRQMGLLMTVLTCMAVRDEDLDQVFRFLFRYTLIVFLLINVVGSLVGYLRGEMLYMWYEGRGARFRLGFDHPNTLSVVFFNLVLLWLWEYYDTLKNIDYLKVLAATFVVYCITKTRTMPLIVLVLVFLVFAAKHDWLNNKFLQLITMGIVPAFSLFFYIATRLYRYNLRLINLADRLLNGRIRLSAIGYTVTESLTLFGREIAVPPYIVENFTYDCVYTYLMTHQGVIWLLLISVGFFGLAWKNSKKENIMLIAWALYAVTEVHGLNVFRCFPLLMTSLLISGRKKQHLSEVP